MSQKIYMLILIAVLAVFFLNIYANKDIGHGTEEEHGEEQTRTQETAEEITEEIENFESENSSGWIIVENAELIPVENG